MTSSAVYSGTEYCVSLGVSLLVVDGAPGLFCGVQVPDYSCLSVPVPVPVPVSVSVSVLVRGLRTGSTEPLAP